MAESGNNRFMVFRVGERRGAVRAHGSRIPDVAIAEALAAFDQPVDPQPNGTLRIGDHDFVYDPSEEPRFVLVPTCEGCGTSELEQFPLEGWVVDGVAVRGQARTHCRDCRFIALADS